MCSLQSLSEDKSPCCIIVSDCTVSKCYVGKRSNILESYQFKKKKKKDPIYSLKKAIVQINIINKAPENKKVAQVNETIIYQEITLSFLIIF